MFGGQHRIDEAETARASWGDTSETTQPKRRDSRAVGKVCAWTEKIPIKPLETVGVVRDNAVSGQVALSDSITDFLLVTCARSRLPRVNRQRNQLMRRIDARFPTFNEGRESARRE